MKRKELDIDTLSVKSEMKKRCRKNNKKNRAERNLIKHGGWVNQY